MAARLHGRVPLVLALTLVLVACGPTGRSSVSPASFTTDLEHLSQAISTSAGYSPDTVELTGNRIRLQIAVSDVKLVQADESARNAAASAMVALVEQSQTTYPELEELQVISVSILHRSGPEESPKNWHMEDVIEFRKGPSQRFAIHVT